MEPNFSLITMLNQFSIDFHAIFQAIRSSHLAIPMKISGNYSAIKPNESSGLSEGVIITL